MNAEDLPRAVRERLGLPTSSRKRAKPSRAGTGLTDSGPGTCSCGEEFPTAAKWERHVRALPPGTPGHSWAIDLTAAYEDGDA